MEKILKSVLFKNGEKYLTEKFKYDAYGNLLEQKWCDKDGNIMQTIKYSGFVGKYNK